MIGRSQFLKRGGLFDRVGAQINRMLLQRRRIERLAGKLVIHIKSSSASIRVSVFGVSLVLVSSGLRRQPESIYHGKQQIQHMARAVPAPGVGPLLRCRVTRRLCVVIPFD